MKKISYLLVGLTTMLFCINSTNAMSVNNDGTMINSKGAIITLEQYERLSEVFASSIAKEKKIDYLDQEDVDHYSNTNVNISFQQEYYITTYTLDRYGNVINTITIPSTKEEAKEVSENKNLHVMPNGKLQDISQIASINGVINGGSYATASKSLELHYDGQYASMYVTWMSLPKVKSYDVIAFRGENFNNIQSYTAYQLSNVDETYYSKNGTNTKISSNGIGVSMNLHDNATVNDGTAYVLYLRVSANSGFGECINATYQHAVNNISLATSQSYTFGSSGLGGVLVYSNGYSKYFDNMNGLRLRYS